MHEWIGDIGFVALDTEMDGLMQDARIRKFFREEGILHFGLFFLTVNPDGVTPQTALFTRLMISETPQEKGEGEYAIALINTLIEHYIKLIKHEEDKRREAE